MGALGPPSYALLLKRLCFQSKKGNALEGFTKFGRIPQIYVKFIFFRGNHDLAWIFAFLGRKSVFSPLGLQKSSQKLMFSLLLRGSPQGPVFGPNERLWGPKPQNGWNFTILDQNGVVPLYQSWCLFKMSSISLGILDILNRNHRL